jgi:hypothetical protein
MPPLESGECAVTSFSASVGAPTTPAPSTTVTVVTTTTGPLPTTTGPLPTLTPDVIEPPKQLPVGLNQQYHAVDPWSELLGDRAFQ